LCILDMLTAHQLHLSFFHGKEELKRKICFHRENRSVLI
jgi:hypothetical protein